MIFHTLGKNVDQSFDNRGLGGILQNRDWQKSGIALVLRERGHKSGKGPETIPWVCANMSLRICRSTSILYIHKWRCNISCTVHEIHTIFHIHILHLCSTYSASTCHILAYMREGHSHHSLGTHDLM